MAKEEHAERYSERQAVGPSHEQRDEGNTELPIGRAMKFLALHQRDCVLLVASCESLESCGGPLPFGRNWRTIYPDSPIQGRWTYRELRELGEGPVEIPANGDMAGRLRKVPVSECGECNHCDPDPLTDEDERIFAEIWDDIARQRGEKKCRAAMRARKKRANASARSLEGGSKRRVVYPPACLECDHWIMIAPVADTCTAFPTGIPDEIFLYGDPHTESCPGDGGTRFQRRRWLMDEYSCT